MKEFNVKKFIEELTSLGERQLDKEVEAKEMIISYLNKAGYTYNVQNYTTFIPSGLSHLHADGSTIESKPTSFVGGNVDTGNIISSLTSSQSFLFTSNINFNPSCKVISKNNHYFAPSLAVAKSDVCILLEASDIEARVEIEKRRHNSANILAGNIDNPTTIVFTHYDSIETGAIDNASGVALTLLLVHEHPDLLGTTLFVIAGNEELSYDEPIYWGHGYRVFEEMYEDLLKQAKKVFVLDSLGQGETFFTQEKSLVTLGFPLKNLDTYLDKTRMVHGDINELMKVYHSTEDQSHLISTEEIRKTAQSIYQQISQL